MKYLILSKNKKTLICDCHWSLVSKYKWSLHSAGYAFRNDYSKNKRKIVLLHRLIMDTPSGLVVDHINGDKLDNQCSNLRNCTRANNIQAGRGWNRDLPKNIYKTRFNKYEVKLTINYRPLRIGTFNTLRQAESAALSARKEYYGEYAR